MIHQSDHETAHQISQSAADHKIQDLGLKAARNRKIYNGMLKTYFYQFPGPKPPNRRRAGS